MKKFIDKKVLLISGIVFSFLFVLVIGSFLLKGKEPISTEVEEYYHRTEEIYQVAMATIEDAQQNVTPSADKNFERWPGIQGKKIQYENKKCAKISINLNKKLFENCSKSYIITISMEKYV